MRVALVHPFSWPDVRRGGERYLHDLASYLTRQGVEVDLVVGGAPGSSPGRDGRVVRLRHLRRLAVGGLTPVDTFGLAAAGLAGPAPLRRRARPDPDRGARGRRHPASAPPTPRSAIRRRTSIARRRLDLPMFRTTVRRVHAPLALSESAAAAVADLTGRRPRVVPPGLRTADFALRDRPRVGPARILFASDASDRRKGLDVLVEAFALVLDALPDARLALGGGGGGAWALDRLPAEVRQRVAAATDDIGTGSLDDVPARYAAATTTVLPSLDEAFGLVLVESLATGTPVVATASGGPLEIVDDDAVGRLFPPRDPSALAAAIRATVALAADPATPARCARQARRWDWETTVGPLHLDTYAGIARGRSR